MATKIEWKDIRPEAEKTVTSWEAQASLGGHTARVWTLPRTGDGKDWGAEAGGRFSQHSSLELAYAAAGRRLRAAAARDDRTPTP